MGFLDKAKQAATELAAKADGALDKAGAGGSSGGSRQGDRLLRDLGVLAYREYAGHAVEPADRARVQAELAALEQQGRLGQLTLQGGPPPPPGAAGATPSPPHQTPAPSDPPDSSPGQAPGSPTERPAPPPPPPPPAGTSF